MAKHLKLVTSIFVFAGAVVLAALLLGNAFTPWTKISGSRFRHVKYDKYSQIVWLAESYGDAVYEVQRLDNGYNFRDAAKIGIPNGSVVNSMCVSNGIWISSFMYEPQTAIKPNPSDFLTIYIYTSNTKLWQSLAVSAKIEKCKSLNSEGVVFWGQNEIIRFDATRTQPQYINVNSGWWIRDVTDDLDGNLWISTIEGKIYKHEQQNWILVDDFGDRSSPQLFFDKDGRLWVYALKKYIYKYSSDYTMPRREQDFDLPLDTAQPELLSETVMGFFQDNNGLIWLATNRRFLVEKEGQFYEQDFALPPHTTYINFGFYNSETNTIFVSTAKGVFALDLDELDK